MKHNKQEKDLYGNFKRQTAEIAHEMNWEWLRRWNFKRETESLLIVAQNNAEGPFESKLKLIIPNRIVSRDYVIIELKQLIIYWLKAEHWH